MEQTAKISAVGDCAVLVELGNEISPEINSKVISLVQLIKEQPIEGAADTIPTFCSLLVNYDPRVISYEKICRRLSDLARLDTRTDEKSAKVFQIPVCYSGDYAPDIEYIAERAGLSVQEVVEIHSGQDYLIYMLGFMPGFPYLGGLDERIHTPRLEIPRVQIRAGSVGIGGTQTGIYPLDSPGGWQLLGMTPLKTYDPTREKPILFEAVDYIRFVPIEKSEFEEIKARVDDGSYEYNF